MKKLLRAALFLLALPVAAAAVLILVVQGCKREDKVICDPVHEEPASKPASGSGANPAPSNPDNSTTRPPPPVCDPVIPPPGRE